jgi:hypothetical protein
MRSGLNIEIDFSIHKIPYMGRIPDLTDNVGLSSEKVSEIVLSEQDEYETANNEQNNRQGRPKRSTR